MVCDSVTGVVTVQELFPVALHQPYMSYVATFALCARVFLPSVGKQSCPIVLGIDAVHAQGCFHFHAKMLAFLVVERDVLLDQYPFPTTFFWQLLFLLKQYSMETNYYSIY